MDAVATVDQLQGRLDWTMDLGERNVAQGALEDLSDDARDLGKKSWVDPSTTPEPVVRLVLRAAARYMRNPEGYVMSRSGDETAQFHDNGRGAGSPTFTDDEASKLRRLAKRQSITSVELTAYRTVDRPARVGCVPSEGDNRSFPVFYDDENNLPPLPWWYEQPMLPYFGED